MIGPVLLPMPAPSAEIRSLHPLPTTEEYNQWKQALGVETATPPAELTVRPGFQVELLRSARIEEGSWVSVTFDAKGRLLIGREGPGILRLTLSTNQIPSAEASMRVETVNNTLNECRGLLWAFDSLYVNANNSKGFYRLRDSDGDDQFDEVKLLKSTGGDVGHGRNALALGPDNLLYLIHGNDVRLPDDYTPAASPFRNYAEDQLLPCPWNTNLFNAGTKVPAGHVIRTDPDGKKWEMMAGGFRNPYGIAFNEDGEMFTYDADMEWDIGAPWYRPTRVNHIVSGADYGWRQGTGKMAAYYPDSVPSNLDIGPGSPTGVKFGTQSKFPTQYRRALFILDWAYGRILAIHLQPTGASYTGADETFIKGRPLNVTDLAFGPDGAMYFVTGGRRTQSGLYRVSYVGPQVDEEPKSKAEQSQLKQAAQARALRRRLETFHGREDPRAIATAWPHLDSADVWIRQAARVALEHQPPAQWQRRTFRESRPAAALTALLALARVGDKSLQPDVLKKLNALPVEKYPTALQLVACRAYELCFIRMGQPNSALANTVAERLDTLYPSSSTPLNQELCKLLVYLGAPRVIEKSLALLGRAETQEEQLHYLFVLRLVRQHWTPAQRQTYFEWLQRAEQFKGAHYMPTFLNYIKADALGTLSSAERAFLEPILAKSGKTRTAPLPSMPQREFVKDWQFSDLADSLGAIANGRNFSRGKAVFTTAQCIRCHHFKEEGTTIGPDLTAVSSRLNRLALLESTLVPSAVVDDKYRNLRVMTRQGEEVEGRLISADDKTITLSTDPLTEGALKQIALADVAGRTLSPISPMPAGLLNTFSREEILDLLAYLESGGDPDHRDFQP